jgi:hypothetical protein
MALHVALHHAQLDFYCHFCFAALQVCVQFSAAQLRLFWHPEAAFELQPVCCVHRFLGVIVKGAKGLPIRRDMYGRWFRQIARAAGIPETSGT